MTTHIMVANFNSKWQPYIQETKMALTYFWFSGVYKGFQTINKSDCSKRNLNSLFFLSFFDIAPYSFW